MYLILYMYITSRGKCNFYTPNCFRAGYYYHDPVPINYNDGQVP